MARKHNSRNQRKTNDDNNFKYFPHNMKQNIGKVLNLVRNIYLSHIMFIIIQKKEKYIYFSKKSTKVCGHISGRILRNLGILSMCTRISPKPFPL